MDEDRTSRQADAGARPGAVFLDRDGTIIEDRGHLGSIEQVVFYPRALAALRELGRSFRLFIVTNQTGVGEGTITAGQARAVNRHVVERLAAGGVEIVRTYTCPHRRSEGCICIKPNPHWLLEAARAYDVDLARSWVVGDHPHDVELARRAGARGVYVLTGHGAKHRADVPQGTSVAEDISEAARLILDERS
ncbi:MAG: D-glycero-beta-D-manno-heptose-1,7-bisphosphate 7-phosphatase [Planctomycetes bacterium ADurb.Bin126]|nr:MAG: D-glycero-beta-D-manno-heptose-1,7-bisphosphate 7-phosphatase [Planctomycetes bacterium ADurb.Bin126]HOD80265.1 HAD family hydrolase [Phycisphaerae bacterium]HQL72186.1 HAD family hydrolase [Phycisphaerae bacterium]